MILKIETGSANPILRKKSEAVDKFDKKLKKFLKNMSETMLKKDGVGLAAPQVGVSARIAIINFQLSVKKSKPIALINPEIIGTSAEITEAEEGCLSLPNLYGDVQRFASVTARFQDENGKNKILELAGLNARAIQHEIDHLNGILFIDKVEGKVKKAEKKPL